MNAGIYRKTQGRTGVGKFYMFTLLARDHTTGAESVIYIPLRVEREWAGTTRFCRIDRAEFERKFEYVGERLPAVVDYPDAYDTNSIHQRTESQATARDRAIERLSEFLRDDNATRMITHQMVVEFVDDLIDAVTPVVEGDLPDERGTPGIPGKG